MTPSGFDPARPLGEVFGCALARIGGLLMWPGNELANLGINIANKALDRRAAIAMEASRGETTGSTAEGGDSAAIAQEPSQ